MTISKGWDCSLCSQHVDGPGPWCILYVETQFCVPVSVWRRRIFDADSEGDGPLVNALCADLRRRTCDNFVP